MDAQSGIRHGELRDHLAARREALRLSKTEAAQRAGVGRMSWWEWERGRRHPHDYNYAGIEAALQWEAGSVQAILDGGNPTEKPPDERREPDLRDETERRLWALGESEQERWDHIKLHRRHHPQRPVEARETG